MVGLTPSIITFTGKRMDPWAPVAEDIDIRDIAHALSNICRFTGHVKEFYSVGEHAVLVADLLAGEDQKWGLLHDASEAYIADVSRPVKQQPGMALYREAEERLQQLIYRKFGLTGIPPERLKWADDMALNSEARSLMPLTYKGHPLFGGLVVVPSDAIKPLRPWEAEELFLKRFGELWGTL